MDAFPAITDDEILAMADRIRARRDRRGKLEALRTRTETYRLFDRGQMVISTNWGPSQYGTNNAEDATILIDEQELITRIQSLILDYVKENLLEIAKEEMQ